MNRKIVATRPPKVVYVKLLRLAVHFSVKTVFWLSLSAYFFGKIGRWVDISVQLKLLLRYFQVEPFHMIYFSIIYFVLLASPPIARKCKALFVRNFVPLNKPELILWFVITNCAGSSVMDVTAWLYLYWVQNDSQPNHLCKPATA